MENTLHKSLLDVALENYDLQAQRYFQEQNAIENAPPDVRLKRDSQLKDIKRFLDSQRMNAESIASIQAKLDAYREEGRQATKGTRSEQRTAHKSLMNEKHHPPSELEKLLVASAKPKPSREHTAHHIVPGKGKTPDAYLSRVHMHTLGVRINDPDNGVWLPTFKRFVPHWSMPKAMGHLEYHTHLYELNLKNRVLSKASEKALRTELNLIGKMMQLNNFPVSEAE